MRRRDFFAVGAAATRLRAETTSEVRMHNGTPWLFINGRPHSGMAYAAYTPAVKVFRDFVQVGVDLYTFVATPTEGGHTRERTCWTAPGKYDYAQLDERVAMVLEANPKAYFFPRLYMHTPRWWSELHPDDLVLAERGDGRLAVFLEQRSGNKPAASWTSAAWRKDTIEGLRRIVAHIEASPYAERCAGYHLASGTTDEWMAWGANDKEWVDYSPVNIAAFRRWLKAKYGTVEGLRKAWGAAGVNFENAMIPRRAARAATEFGTLRDPAREQAVIDFYYFNSDAVAETIGELAGAVKQFTGGKKFVGIFYGYTLQLCAQERQQNAGHLALEKVLACPHVDFLCSPASKSFLQVGGQGTSYFMSLSGSVRLHGKLWFEENDIRTSLTNFPEGSWGRPADVAGDVLQQNKEMAHIFTAGAAQWWFDVGRNRYDDPALMRRLGELIKTAGAALNLDRSPVDQTAMIVDERSLGYMRPGDSMGGWLLNRQLPALSRIGAPVGHYLSADLPKLADRRLFLFMTSFAPTRAERAAVDALKSGGRVLLFFYAPGIYRDGKLDESAMAEFTGMRLRMTRTAAELRAKWSPGHPLTEGLAGELAGIREAVSPVCYADDPGAAVLAAFADGRPAIAVKPHGGWTAVFSAVPMLPAKFLRRLARMAGAHLYIETEDVVWAAREMLAVSVYEPGTRTIRLPRPAAVEDLYSGEQIAAAAGSFEARFEARATRLFAWRTQPGKRIGSILPAANTSRAARTYISPAPTKTDW
jgi:hypothetical protein